MRLRMNVLLLAGVCLLAVASHAQQTLGTITGTVRDSSGAVLPGASVILLNEETGISRNIAANQAGLYSAPALGLGNYRVTASLEGFQTQVRSGIELTVGRVAVVNFELSVGAITQTVEVTGEAPLVETRRGGLGTLVESQTISELPLNGRDLAQLITLQTGSVEYTAGRQEGGKLLVIAGGRPTSNVFLMDGVAIESYTQKTPTGTSGQFLGAEAVREFRVETNSYSAEFGRGSGGIFNIATKSGTNNLHGSLFEYLRNDNLDANRWEANKTGLSRAEFKRNQFGGSLGGPIVHDRTFFFGTYEGLRERLGEPQILTTFGDELRAGTFPGSSAPVAAVRPYVDSPDLWPRPNGRINADGTGLFNFNYTTPTDEDMMQIRIDHKLSDSDNIFGRYTYLKSDQTNLLGFPNELAGDTVKNQYVTLEWSRIISPTILNTARLGFTRNAPFNETLPQNIDASLFFVPPSGQLGDLSVSGVSSVGEGVTGEYRILNSFQFIDDMSITKGNHSLKFGLHWNRIQFNGWNPARDAANFAFSNIRNFYRNSARRFRGAIAEGFNDAFRSFRENIIGLYLQDDYQLFSRLTLNLGLRYEFITTPTENHDRVSTMRGDYNFMINTTADQFTLGNPWIENPSLKNIAPRLGFAWDVFGDGKTAMRGGAGLFFMHVDQSWFRTAGFRVPPFLIETEATSGILFPTMFQVCGKENPFNPTNPNCSGRPAPDMLQWKFASPYVIQYNLNVQREVLPNTVLTLGYAGSRGIRLPAVANMNSWSPVDVNGHLEFPQAVVDAGVRPNPNFDNMRLRHVGYNSWYNSMQLNVTRKYAQGLQLNGSYTWSKNLDEISGLQTASDTESGPNSLPSFHHKDIYKGRSSFDARHIFTFSSTYELPIGSGRTFGSGLSGVANAIVGGWQVGGIVTMSSGFPGTITIEGRFSDLGHGEEFPDLKSGSSTSPTSGGSLGCTVGNGNRVIAAGTKLGTPDLYFDPCAFSFPVGNALGNLGRNTLQMPGRAVVDFNLTKKFNLGSAESGRKLEFKFDAFNLFNRVNLGIPALNIFDDGGRRDDADVGEINSTTGTSRQIQLALKYIF